MTAILWVGDRLYADTKVTKGEEVFHSLTKIRGLKEPLSVVSKKHDIVDQILGWTSCGTTLSAEAFIAHLQGLKDFDKVTTIYNVAIDSKLATYETSFEIVLIGVKSNYNFRFDNEGFVYRPFPHKNVWGMGSGGKITVETIIERNADPIRAMYSTFYRDTLSGGMIDVWEILRPPRVSKPIFCRMGLCRELEGEELLRVISDITSPLRPTYNNRYMGLAYAIEDMGLDEGKDTTALINFIKQRKKSKKKFQKPEKPVRKPKGVTQNDITQKLHQTSRQVVQRAQSRVRRQRARNHKR